jgi:hypothetical protein
MWFLHCRPTFCLVTEMGKHRFKKNYLSNCNCGNTDSNFFALDPKIVPKLVNLRFGNSKIGKTG